MSDASGNNRSRCRGGCSAAAAAEIGARAYLAYCRRRKADSGRNSPALPLPDSFIGVHAQILGWTLATADKGRYWIYFPKVRLKAP